MRSQDAYELSYLNGYDAGYDAGKKKVLSAVADIFEKCALDDPAELVAALRELQTKFGVKK